MDVDAILETAASVDHGQPDYTELDELIENLDNPWGVLKDVVRRIHAEWL